MPQFKVSYTQGNPAIPMKNGAGVLWRKWRLLENRALYDVESDPHQDHDVASQHPQIVAAMRAHLDRWWEGVRGDVMKPQRVVIGHEAENPMLLTACEWLDVFVDQQIQIRGGELKNGTWHLRVASDGDYRFELRRWPRESELALRASVPETKVTDGTFPRGKPLPIASATVSIGDISRRLEPDGDGRSFTATFPLAAGDIELQTAFLDERGEPLCGAYYVYVERLEPKLD